MKAIVYRGQDPTVIDYIDSGQLNEVKKHGNKFHEFYMLETIARLRLPEGVFIDIGAHVGNHSIFFAKYCHRNVIAFEASKITAEVFSHNVSVNGLDNKIEVHNSAIGNTDGECQVIHNIERPGQSKVVEGEGSEIHRLQAPTTSLIKIDVEGNELEVVEGCLEVINRDHPELFIETFGDPKIILDMLPKGYKLRRRYNNAPTYHYSWQK